MRFANSIVLVWIWAVPVVWIGLRLLLRRKQKKMEAVIDSTLLPEVTTQYSLRLEKRKINLLAVSFLCLIIALARPQWGYVMEKVKHQGLDILLAVDVSKSMMTADVKPNRLGRTKLAIKDLLKKVQGDRVGLIAFSGEAFVMCPLTVDYNGFNLSLDEIGINSIPLGGTNISKAIKEALKTFGNDQLKYKALIILTDGEQEQGDGLAAAKEAKEKGVKVFTIGIGTQEGELIQVPDENGTLSFLKDKDGNFVKSRLNEDLLQRIAYETSGAYIRSSGAEFGLDYLYTKELSNWAKRDFEEKTEKKYYERYQWPLAVGVFLLLLSL